MSVSGTCLKAKVARIFHKSRKNSTSEIINVQISPIQRAGEDTLRLPLSLSPIW